MSRGTSHRARAAIFDMDGVLVDSGAHHRAAWRMLLAELGAEPKDPEFWRLTIGRPGEEALPRLLGRRLSAGEIAKYSRRKTDLFHQLAEGGFQPVPGAIAFVRALERDNVPRALATSASRRSVAAILDDLGLRSSFAVVVTDDDVERGKPDPEVYLTAASRLQVDPRACVVFEDALVGLEAARRAGMRAVGLATTYTDEELKGAGAARVLKHFDGVTWQTVLDG